MRQDLAFPHSQVCFCGMNTYGKEHLERPRGLGCALLLSQVLQFYQEVSCLLVEQAPVRAEVGRLLVVLEAVGLFTVAAGLLPPTWPVLGLVML